MNNDFYRITASNGVVFYKNKMLEQVDFINHAFSTRLGGVSKNAYASLNLGKNPRFHKEEILENYRLFSSAIDIPVEHMVLSDQVHRDHIHIASTADCGKGILTESDIVGIDGFITYEKGIALVTFYADCTPVLIVDPIKRAIASVHSGWRGTLLKIVQKAVLKMQKTYGSDPKDLLCATGPSIKQCHFEVGIEVYEKFFEVFGSLAKECTEFKNEKCYIDTDRLIVQSLTEIGVLRDNISVCPDCTYCRKDTLYSHRGDQGNTGRMCAVIELK